ncbi:MAG: phosphoenolpyruvate--protein phosphotransferase [Desulfitobacteriaceae bacterium]|nr:phosphoenolpyruvate--protein phosphotransferase [Desulfitobacteriaceae bacterium]MDI6879565.1 phosphoenolpyruvate--protein phosphotransferase [Desulfitobacteriaceae bacterium]MDI6913353.1 phosphoenolpyruvate--protein phosphotransferase [Desulfitobacteriaceae bacterium]
MIGLGVSKGVARGQAQWVRKAVLLPFDSAPVQAENVAAEMHRFRVAVGASVGQIRRLAAALTERFPQEAEIFEAHALILEDDEFLSSALRRIEQEYLSATAAVRAATDELKETFLAMDDAYFQSRAQDMEDIGRRLILNLQGTPPVDLQLVKPGTVLLADDLTPSETAGLNPENVVGIATRMGGKTSHTAILARALRIPAVVGCADLGEIQDGESVVMDGETGEIIARPSAEAWEAAKEAREILRQREHRYAEEISYPAETPDGYRVTLAANLAHPAAATEAVQAGAEEVGLFRTEFLYLGRETAPTEAEQFLAYKTVVEKMGGRPVIFRTLDVGGDKQVPYLGLAGEDNPFLGYRALRICLQERELFAVQIRAILRASALGPVKIMFPMVATLDEIRKAKDLVGQVRQELVANRIPCASHVSVGIMIEIPAAAIRADEFAKEVDFFSIGTNDLIQYTLAADRLNPKLASLYQATDPAVLRLIAGVIEAGHQEGLPVGVCGEMAGQPVGALLLLGMGIDELSMNTGSLPEIKSLIRRIPRAEAVELVAFILKLGTAAEIEAQVRESLRNDFGWV